jgi:hypothetical protein
MSVYTERTYTTRPRLRRQGRYLDLYSLVKNSSLDDIKQKLRDGVLDKNYTDYKGLTILHYSVTLKKSHIFNFLINETDINISIRGNDGKTAFYIACQKGYIFFVKLFSNKSNLEFMRIGDLNGKLPIEIAFNNNHIPIVKYLLNGFVRNHIISMKLQEYETAVQNRKIIERNRRKLFLEQKRQQEKAERLERLERARLAILERLERERLERERLERERLERERLERERLERERLERERLERERLERERREREIKERINSYAITSYIEMLIETKKYCSICLEEFEKDKTVLLKCWHPVCLTCNEHIDKCPICREKV